MIRIDCIHNGVSGLPGYNSFYFNVDDQAGATAARNAVAAFWSASTAAFVNEWSVTIQPDAPIISEATGDITGYTSVDPLTLSGIAAGDVLPTVTQLCLNHRTAGVVAGRRVRGRTFLPGIDEANNGPDGKPTGAFQVFMRENFSDNITDADVQFVIWSRPIDGGRAGSVHPVVSTNTKPDWAYLRSRRD